MKLISENSFEDQLLPGIVSILRDLKIEASGFNHEDAIAPVFWSSEDFSLELAFVRGLRKDEMSAILKSLEPAISEAMIRAGFQVIENYMHKANGSIVYQHHRNLQ